jgi:hypothetical protein
MIGLYGQYGILNAKCGTAAAGTTLNCSGSDVRVGAQVHVHFLPHGPADPWVGAGFGYEWLTDTAEASNGVASAKSSLSVHGFELLNLQAGVDWHPTPSFGLGPFASFALAQYSGGAVDDKDLTIVTAMHEWLTIGVRGSVQ